MSKDTQAKDTQAMVEIHDNRIYGDRKLERTLIGTVEVNLDRVVKRTANVIAAQCKSHKEAPKASDQRFWTTARGSTKKSPEERIPLELKKELAEECCVVLSTTNGRAWRQAPYEYSQGEMYQEAAKTLLEKNPDLIDRVKVEIEKTLSASSASSNESARAAGGEPEPQRVDRPRK